MANPPPVYQTIKYTVQSSDKSEEQNLVDGLRIITGEINTICERLRELSVNVVLVDNMGEMNLEADLKSRYKVLASKIIRM